MLVEVGTGERSFEPLAEGAEVVMVHGPQGGWHMLGSARLTGLGEVVRIHYTITDLDSGVVVSDNNYRVALLMEDDGVRGYYPGMYGYLDVAALESGELDTPPELLAGHRVRMRMEVEGEAVDGEEPATASGEIEVTAAPDPKDVDGGETDSGSSDSGGSDSGGSDSGG